MGRVRQYMQEVRRSAYKFMFTETIKMLWFELLMKMDRIRSSALLLIILIWRVSKCKIMLACLIGGERELFFTLVVGEADTEVGHADHMRTQMHNLRYFPRSMETGLVEVGFSH